VARPRRAAAYCLAIVVLLSGCTGSPEPEATSKPDGQEPTTGASPTPAGCQGTGVDIAAIGLANSSTQEAAGKAFAVQVYGRPATSITRQGPCAVTLEPSGTRLVYAPSDEGGHLRLRVASSFAGDESPPLSMQVAHGEMTIHPTVTCPDCKSYEARVVSSSGRTAFKRVQMEVAVALRSPAAWRDRGLLLRFLDSKQAVRQALFVALPDGDFAAG
jgi:hypothetical protein